MDLHIRTPEESIGARISDAEFVEKKGQSRKMDSLQSRILAGGFISGMGEGSYQKSELEKNYSN